MRAAHYLRDNKNTELPSAAVWFDTESKQHKGADGVTVHELWFGWACYRRVLTNGEWSAPDWLRFESAAELWHWVAGKVRSRTKLPVFCHNTSFDLPITAVFDHLPEMGWKLTRACIDAPPTIITFRQPLKSIVLLDTLNIWRMPLAKLGEMIGFKKLPMPDEGAPREEWDRYGKQDVEVIMQACVRWWRFLADNDLGGFAPTLAGQAMRSYRHRFMPAKVLIDDNAAALALARASYLGGRCECFRLGHITGPLYNLDVNSMYPAVMQNNLFPARLYGYETDRAELAISKFRDTRCMVADVVVETDEPAYPKVVDSKLCFPVGRFRVQLAGPELFYALDHKHVREITSVALYYPEPLFNEFVTEMYARRLALRAEGNETEAWLFKILMNSLYGKFGQRGIVWEESGNTKDKTARTWVEWDVATQTLTRCRQLAGLVQVQSGESEGRDSSPAIAAYVTSYARMLLYRLMCLAGRENIYYCDTDSLLCNQEAYNRLTPFCHPTDLGMLKLEGVFDDGEIWGPKDYRWGQREKHKGVKKSARWLTATTIEQDRWSSLKGLLRNGSLTAPTTSKVSKTLRRLYSKGLVGPAGIVSPLVVEDDGAPVLPEW